MLAIVLSLACLPDRDTTFGAGGERVDPVRDTDFVVQDSDTGDTADTADTNQADADADSDSDSDTDSDADSDVIPGGQDCAVGLGQIACDLGGKDQSGKQWSLWEQYGQGPIVVSVGHAYDGDLQQISGWLASVSAARSVNATVVLVNGPLTTPAATADASDWATEYGLDPVLWGMSAADRASWMLGEQTATYVLDADLKITWIGYGYVGQEKLDDKLKAI